MDAPKKIAVTGGCGYIGSHTVVDLIQHGFDVIVIDDNSRSNEKVLDAIAQITGRKPGFYKVDLKDKNATRKIFEQEKNIEGIIHFAAFKYVDESVQKPMMYFENNLLSLMNMISMADEFKVPHFVFSSSCSVYGNIHELPVSETTALNQSQSPYATTKQMGEMMIEDCSKTSETQYISLRYFNPVGAHDSALIGESPATVPNNLLPRITGAALGKFQSFKIYGTDYPTRDGTCIRDYIHVMDIANAHTKAIVYLAGQKNMPHQYINLGSGSGTTVKEMITAFEKVSGVKIKVEEGPRREGDVVAVYADNTKAKQLLQWTPSRDIDSMMLSAWNWDKKN